MKSSPPNHSRSAQRSLTVLQEALITCRRCPRLVQYREHVAATKRRAYRDQSYWGRPVPGFGDPLAAIVIVGLAPAAHGANRTGRMFTGDRSGDFLFAGLHRAGLASQAESRHAGDGLALEGVYITAPCKCAPPDNKPLPEELTRCTSWLEEELALLERARVYFALGKTGYDSIVRLARSRLPAPRRLEAPPFGHGVATTIADPRGVRSEVALVASYHVSQQNTQTGRLTASMFDDALRAAMRAAELG